MFNAGNSLKGFRLLGRKADGHGFAVFHASFRHQIYGVVNLFGVVVSRYHAMEIPMSKPDNLPEPEPRKPEGHTFHIKIDRTVYTVDAEQRTGLQLRQLVEPPIGADRDLFEVVPGGSDIKILDDQVVDMRDGLRFFTAPAQINPGAR